ncbi:hypothetical protein KM043_012564 [Ampulex compressa]|nr:hypothetical protein KM043_012564 [Ampulex compressa]
MAITRPDQNPISQGARASDEYKQGVGFLSFSYPAFPRYFFLFPSPRVPNIDGDTSLAFEINTLQRRDLTVGHSTRVSTRELAMSHVDAIALITMIIAPEITLSAIVVQC